MPLEIPDGCADRRLHHRCLVKIHPRTTFLSLSLAVAGTGFGSASSEAITPRQSHPTPGHFRAGTEPQSPPARHPIKGVIVAVRADKQALLVKHEEIPGVMRAMTMLLKTDPTTIGRVAKGQAITGLLSRRDDGWWIESIKVTP